MSDQEIAHFQKVESEMLEQAWATQASQCTLPDGCQALFSHMVLISPAGGFKTIARFTHLYSTEAVADLTLRCLRTQYRQFKTWLTHIELEKHFPNPTQAGNLLRLCSVFGIAVKKYRMYGTQEALDSATQAFNQYCPGLFPDIQKADIYLKNGEGFLSLVAKEKNVLILGNAAYGAPRNLSDFLKDTKDYEYVAERPNGLPDLVVAQTCAELNIVQYNNSLIGRQLNVQTALERLKLIEVDIPPSVGAIELALMFSHVAVKLEQGKIKGLKDDVATALLYLRELDSIVITEGNFLFNTIQAICEKYKCSVEGKRLIGPRGQVKAALEELKLKKVKEPQTRNFYFQYHVPSPWFLNQEVPLDFETPESDSSEFLSVSQRFAETLRQKRVVRIMKVFNKRLYTNFAFKHESLSQIEGRVLETMMLFHGTRQTDPSLIYLSDEGLDSRLGQGTWGQGTYFAKDAAYSDRYCHKNPEGQQEILLCEALVGDYVELRPGPYVKPPQKPGSASCYHSIRGLGTNIWITYEASMSYPTYLITYQ